MPASPLTRSLSAPLAPSASPAPLREEEVEGIGVIVRVRPLSTKERADPSIHNCIQALSDSLVVDGNVHKRPPARLASKSGRGPGATSGRSSAAPATQPVNSSTRPYQFSVDRVFHTHASQIEVYEHSCKRVVEGVFHGVNGAILAYGATGSGKTHTMFGSTMSAAGIVYQAVQDIFAEKERLEEEEGKRVRLKCSFLEVYNEDVFDLFVTASGDGVKSAKRVPLQVRETGAADADARHCSSNFGSFRCSSNNGGNGGDLHIHGLTHIFPETLADFAHGIEHGHAQRFVAATGANAQSSRSHAIITVEVEVRDGPMAEEEMHAASGSASARPPTGATRQGSVAPTVTIAKLRFGDLAGSERAAATSNTGVRLREGGSINRSLLALGTVVQGLAQQRVRRRQTGGSGGQNMFIPYRGSKLTRLLRDSIGGNCRTMMVFCVSPSAKQVEETVNTMKFAMNAREIQVIARRNEFTVDSRQLAKTQETVIEELRAELARAHSALSHYTGEDPSASPPPPSTSTTVITAPGSSASARGRAKPRTSARYARQLSTASLENGLGGQDSDEAAEWLSPVATAQPVAAAVTAANAATSSITSAPVGSAALAPQEARHTLTPSTRNAASGPTGKANSVSPTSTVDVSPNTNSIARQSTSAKPMRTSVFAESTPLFSELEGRLKDFSAEKESLYHAVREAEERARDGDSQLRDQQWRLATFLVSDTYGSRARGEVDIRNDGGTIGVVGLRKTLVTMEAAQAQHAASLSSLTTRLEEADRQFAATRAALLRERQGTALELLLDNARLRQGCTEAECLAAHYHQECRSMLNSESEYAEALSKCVGALQRMRPIVGHLIEHGAASGTATSADISGYTAATEAMETALLFALLPTSSTTQRMQVFEAALRSSAVTLKGQASPNSTFTHPPLAPSPTKRTTSGSTSPMRHNRSASTPQSSQLEEQFRNLVATAELMHLTNNNNGNTSGNASRVGGVVGLDSANSSTTLVTMDGAAAAMGAGYRGRHGHGTAPGHGRPDACTPTKPRSFGRTVSLTGLTTGSSTAGAKPQARSKTATGSSIAVAGGNSAVAHSTSSGVGRAPKKQPSQVPTLGGKHPIAAQLQRSASAPLPFARIPAEKASAESGAPLRSPRSPPPAAQAATAAGVTRRGTTSTGIRASPKKLSFVTPAAGPVAAAGRAATKGKPSSAKASAFTSATTTFLRSQTAVAPYHKPANAVTTASAHRSKTSSQSTSSTTTTTTTGSAKPRIKTASGRAVAAASSSMSTSVSTSSPAAHTSSGVRPVPASGRSGKTAEHAARTVASAHIRDRRASLTGINNSNSVRTPPSTKAGRVPQPPSPEPRPPQTSSTTVVDEMDVHDVGRNLQLTTGTVTSLSPLLSPFSSVGSADRGFGDARLSLSIHEKSLPRPSTSQDVHTNHNNSGNVAGQRGNGSGSPIGDALASPAPSLPLYASSPTRYPTDGGEYPTKEGGPRMPRVVPQRLQRLHGEDLTVSRSTLLSETSANSRDQVMSQSY